jgi:hypothetical protein
LFDVGPRSLRELGANLRGQLLKQKSNSPKPRSGGRNVFKQTGACEIVGPRFAWRRPTKENIWNNKEKYLAMRRRRSETNSTKPGFKELSGRARCASLAPTYGASCSSKKVTRPSHEVAGEMYSIE